MCLKTESVSLVNRLRIWRGAPAHAEQNQYNLPSVFQTLPKAFAKSFAPCLIARLPGKAVFRFGIRRAAYLRHHRDADIANYQPGKPDRDVERRFGANRTRKLRQPDIHSRWLIVVDVVDAWLAMLNRRNRRRCGVVDVGERPDARAIADER